MARSQSRLTAEIDFNRNGKQHGFIRLPYSVHRSAYGWTLPDPAAGRLYKELADRASCSSDEIGSPSLSAGQDAMTTSNRTMHLHRRIDGA